MTYVLSITIVHLWEQEFVQLNIEPGTTSSKDSQYSLTFFTSIEPERLIGGWVATIVKITSIACGVCSHAVCGHRLWGVRSFPSPPNINTRVYDVQLLAIWHIPLLAVVLLLSLALRIGQLPVVHNLPPHHAHAWAIFYLRSGLITFEMPAPPRLNSEWASDSFVNANQTLIKAGFKMCYLTIECSIFAYCAWTIIAIRRLTILLPEGKREEQLYSKSFTLREAAFQH